MRAKRSENKKERHRLHLLDHSQLIQEIKSLKWDRDLLINEQNTYH